MTLFSSDLYRSFGIGFVAGTLIVGAATIGHWGPALESPAIASEPLEAPAPSSEFLIEPLEITE